MKIEVGRSRSGKTLLKRGAKVWYVYNESGSELVLILDGCLWRSIVMNSDSMAVRHMFVCTFRHMFVCTYQPIHARVGQTHMNIKLDPLLHPTALPTIEAERRWIESIEAEASK